MRNDDTIKIAQKWVTRLSSAKILVIIRIKARPDSDIDLTDLYNAIWKRIRWASGICILVKMLLNGSVKDRSSTPSPLTLNQVVKMALEICKQRLCLKN